MTSQNTTALDAISNALQAFWNASIGAAHQSQDPQAMAMASMLSQGFAAMADELRVKPPVNQGELLNLVAMLAGALVSAMAQGKMKEGDRIVFTGKWAHLGQHRYGALLNMADQALDELTSEGAITQRPAEPLKPWVPEEPDNWQPPALSWNTIMTHGGDCLSARFENFDVRIPLRGSTQAYIDEKKAHYQAEFNGYARHLLKLLGVEPEEAQPTTGPQRRDAVVEAVRADLHRRSQLGIAKYGTTLAENTGDHRAKLQHFYEELLDGANYCKWAMMELDNDAGK